MLHIHRAERADGLADALGELLAAPLDDPFAPEVVVGADPWDGALALPAPVRLARSVARPALTASARTSLFPTPRRLIGDAIATASGVDPDGDPWLPERSVWPLLEVVDGALAQPWLDKLSTHLGHGDDAPDPVRQTRRLSVVRHLAELFDRYSLHRPEMVRAWAAGDLPPATATDAAWQARAVAASCASGSASRARPSDSRPRAPRCATTGRAWSSRRGWRCSASRVCPPPIC